MSGESGLDRCAVVEENEMPSTYAPVDLAGSMACRAAEDFDATQHPSQRRAKRRKIRPLSIATGISALLAWNVPIAMAQSCIPLAGSTGCPAFNASSISTNTHLAALFPFLSTVTDTLSFDSALHDYIANGFTQLRYQQLIGCSNVNLANTTHFYARYTSSVLCNAIVQNSIRPCGLAGDATTPLCADSCAEYAQSEQEISASDVCGTAGEGALTQIRADFTNCALPANSLSGACIEGVQNEPDDCGFASNLGGLCTYCSASSPNSTDSCCVFSNTTSRCTDVKLPIIASSALQPIVTSTATSSSIPTSTSSGSGASGALHRGLTGGQIAGIAIGAVLGALLLLALIILGCLLLRRKKQSSPPTSVFNQPATTRQQQPPMAFHDGAKDQGRASLATGPGGRVARMLALECPDTSERDGGASLLAAGGPYRKSTSDEGETPSSRGPALRPPTTGKRSGSLSSGSALGMYGADETTPSSTDQYTSPESQGQSEQLAFFKDYYSQDEIHQGNVVATLWAYEPRAADEFQLDRGDMVKVIGIWDDGWATGVRVRQKAEDWRPEDKVQRDSGLSDGSSRPPDTREGEGEIKAFPLVCVCLPQHWRKTIEGDSTEGTAPGSFNDMP